MIGIRYKSRHFPIILVRFFATPLLTSQVFEYSFDLKIE